MSAADDKAAEDARFRLWLATKGGGLMGVPGDKKWNRTVAEVRSETDKATRPQRGGKK